MQFERSAGGAALVLLTLALGGVPCRAQGTIVLESGFVSDVDSFGNVNFKLLFNRPPDFFDTDAYDRQADAFQFYIATSTNVPIYYPPRPYASLIRGGEIHYGAGIVVRSDGPPDDSDPHSGGWGSIRGEVGFNVAGDAVWFSVPAGVLGVQGPFAYSLLLTRYGAATRNPYTGESGFPIPVPEPAATTLLLAAFLARVAVRKEA